MRHNFSLESFRINSLSSLPDAWNASKFRELLKRMEYEDTADTSEADLKELCCMALTDLDPSDAAGVLLGFLFEKELKPGQISNLSNEMLEEKLWEEYSDLSMHEQFFNAQQLLFDAFGKGVPKPEALKFQFRLLARQARDLEAVRSDPEVAIIRLLVQGMPENTKIKRLYEDQLEGGPFEDAKHIVWQLKLTEELPPYMVVEGISSHYWFSDLKQLHDFEAELLTD